MKVADLGHGTRHGRRRPRVLGSVQHMHVVEQCGLAGPATDHEDAVPHRHHPVVAARRRARPRNLRPLAIPFRGKKERKRKRKEKRKEQGKGKGMKERKKKKKEKGREKKMSKKKRREKGVEGMEVWAGKETNACRA